MATDGITSLVVNGATIEAVDRGKGRTILFLHPGIGIDPAAPVLAALARGGRVIAPSHPGFGASQLPKGMTTVDDLAYFYLDMIEQLDLRDVLVVGIGLGGWIAAEIAIKDQSRLSHLVMRRMNDCQSSDQWVWPHRTSHLADDARAAQDKPDCRRNQ